MEVTSSMANRHSSCDGPVRDEPCYIQELRAIFADKVRDVAVTPRVILQKAKINKKAAGISGKAGVISDNPDICLRPQLFASRLAPIPNKTTPVQKRPIPHLVVDMHAPSVRLPSITMNKKLVRTLSVNDISWPLEARTARVAAPPRLSFSQTLTATPGSGAGKRDGHSKLTAVSSLRMGAPVKPPISQRATQDRSRLHSRDGVFVTDECLRRLLMADTVQVSLRKGGRPVPLILTGKLPGGTSYA